VCSAAAPAITATETELVEVKLRGNAQTSIALNHSQVGPSPLAVEYLPPNALSLRVN